MYKLNVDINKIQTEHSNKFKCLFIYAFVLNIMSSSSSFLIRNNSIDFFGGSEESTCVYKTVAETRVS